MEELPLLINYMSYARKKFNQFFKIHLKIFFLRVEKREGEMVPYAEGSSIKGSSQQSWTSPLSLREDAHLKCYKWAGVKLNGGAGVGKRYYTPS